MSHVRRDGSLVCGDDARNALYELRRQGLGCFFADYAQDFAGWRNPSARSTASVREHGGVPLKNPDCMADIGNPDQQAEERVGCIPLSGTREVRRVPRPNALSTRRSLPSPIPLSGHAPKQPA